MAKDANVDDLEEVRDALTDFGEEHPDFSEYLAPTFHGIAKRYLDQGRSMENYELARLTISQAEQLNLSLASKMRLGNYQRDLATGHGVLVAEQGMYGNPMFGQVYYSLINGLNYDNSRYCVGGRGGMEACSNVRANLERAQQIPDIARKADEQRYQSQDFSQSGYGFDPNRSPSGFNPPAADFTQDSLLPGTSGFYGATN